MERVTLNAELRDKSGKGAARSLRREGGIPAVIYRAGKAQPLKLDARETLRLIRTSGGEMSLIDLKFPGDKSRLALVKEYQNDPIDGSLLHVDFQEVSLTDKVKVTVHVVTVGEPIGVKRDGGILQHQLREIEIECQADRIPGHIEADVSALLTGHSIHVSDLTLPEGVKVLTDPAEVVASVMAPTLMAEAAPAAAAAEEMAAPEVIKKGKKEETAEEGKEEGKKEKGD